MSSITKLTLFKLAIQPVSLHGLCGLSVNQPKLQASTAPSSSKGIVLHFRKDNRLVFNVLYHDVRTSMIRNPLKASLLYCIYICHIIFPSERQNTYVQLDRYHSVRATDAYQCT